MGLQFSSLSIVSAYKKDKFLCVIRLNGLHHLVNKYGPARAQQRQLLITDIGAWPEAEKQA